MFLTNWNLYNSCILDYNKPDYKNTGFQDRPAGEATIGYSDSLKRRSSLFYLFIYFKTLEKQTVPQEGNAQEISLNGMKRLRISLHAETISKTLYSI